ncbi:MAG: CusA/CzcA family heavy metal efflux RND transporter [Planctomycetes bacterium]|nr:CusA/CzcA family heavy metal efflux RND transporter [Planctomycetota bacterium]
MIDKIIEFSAKNKFIVIFFTIAALVGAVYSMRNIPLDAIPDLSDTQVIIYSTWDRSPDIVEDQVTYPIVTAMLGAPRVKAIRGFSDFGFSYVYVIFQDGTDIYWARSRTVEYLSKITARLPEGVHTEIGPDATGVGWVYQYALVDKSGQNSLADLRTFQDWYLRYWLQGVPGVAEVASVGGFQKQYQVNVNPNALLAYNIPLSKVVEAVRQSNNDIGARVLEMTGTEYMIRAKGYIKSPQDLENTVIGTDMAGTPILVKNVANVVLGPDMRRGIADLDGEGDTVGGIIVIRQGENALNVINRVKAKIEEIKPSLPKGVQLVITYDRSDLIHRAIETLKHQLVEEMIIVSFVILLFLWHFPSAIIPIVTIPIAVVLSFIPMYGMKLTANIMSISGIAISIGVLVDGAIVEVENAYRKLELWQQGGRKGDFHAIRLQALKEVGPSVFFSLLVIAVAFLPVFTLVDQEGRLFKPLAYSKNLAMAIAALLAITLDPAIRMLFTRMDYHHFRPRPLAWLYNTLTVGKYYPEEKHPVSRVLFAVYEPVCNFVLNHRILTVCVALLLMGTTVPVYFHLGSEFMPPLNEGTILYMPTTLPGLSVTEAANLLQVQDKILKSVPEVERVFGKAGRASTSTDPAPFSMMETTVVLKDKKDWRPGLTWQKLVDELDAKMKIPGVTNAWTMPIRARIDMLTTGVRTPIGIKIFGAKLDEIEKIGVQLEKILKPLPGTRSVYAERTSGGYFVDFTLKREQLARYGLTVDEAEMIIMSAVGGENVTTAIQGPERYGVNVRYARDYRDDLEKLQRVLVPTMSGAQIPLGAIADISVSLGPGMIRDENGMMAGYVYVDMTSQDIGGYVARAKEAVHDQLQLPPGYALQWSGQFENMLRVRERLKVIVPLTILIIFVLLYLNTKHVVKAAIVLLAVPFSLIGAIWMLYFLGYNISIAVWVGMIALMGLDAETGVFMLLFLDLSYHEWLSQGRLKTYNDLKEAVIHGAVKRVRPKIMTVMAMFMGLIPIMWSMGTGADVMKRIAAPMIGGVFTSFMLELLVYPVLYITWKWRYELKHGQALAVGAAGSNQP